MSKKVSVRISTEYGTLLLYSPTLLDAETSARIAGDNTLQANIDLKADDNTVVHLAGAEAITGPKDFSEAITATSGFKDADVTTAVKLGDSGNTAANTGNKTILGAINELAEKTSGGGSAPLPIYLTNVPSSIVGAYNQLNYSLPATQTIFSAVVNNNEALIKTFIFGLPVNTTLLPSGNWVFNLYTYVSATVQTTRIRAEVFARTSGGVETTLFSVNSADINLTSVSSVKIETFQNEFAINATDYLGVRFYANTTAPINVTTYLYAGNGNPTYVTTPLQMRHDLLRDIKYVSDNKSGALHLTNGSDTLYGVKTFNASPVVPTPVGNSDAAPKGYVDALVTGGVFTADIRQSPIYSTFTGWLHCDGSAVSRTTYSSLFTQIGTIYGSGDGSTTFNIPDFRGCFLRGRDNGTLTSAVGTKQLSAAPNITGTAGLSRTDGYYWRVASSSGALTSTATGSIATMTSTGGNTGINRINLDASISNAAYGRDSTTEVRPTNHSIYMYIKY